MIRGCSAQSHVASVTFQLAAGQPGANTNDLLPALSLDTDLGEAAGGSDPSLQKNAPEQHIPGDFGKLTQTGH